MVSGSASEQHVLAAPEHPRVHSAPPRLLSFRPLCYCFSVSIAAKIRCQSRARLIFGLLMCSLLCTFAVMAKAALFSPHQRQVHGLTSTKVWQKNTGEQASVPVVPEAVIAAAIVLLAALVPSVPLAPPTKHIPLFLESCFFSALAVRPPPSL